MTTIKKDRKEQQNKVKDLRGKIFGRLTVIKRNAGKANKWGNVLWVCLCFCGKEVVVPGGQLTGGKTRSCGCLRKGSLGTHGKSRREKGGKEHSIYIAWQSMKRRCRDKKNPWYGGRGVKHSAEWKNFECFWIDMEKAWKPGLSLDRINPDGNYCKENCRWATIVEQARNKRRTKKILYRGEIKALTEWCALCKVSYDRVCYRIKQGWSVEEALELPVYKKPKH